MMVLLKGLTLSRSVMSPLKTGRDAMAVVTFLCTRNPTSCSCRCSFATEVHSVTTICWDFPRIHLQEYSTSCNSSSTFPAALRVLTFQVAMVVSSLPRRWRRQHTCRSRPCVLCRTATDPVLIFYHSLPALVVCRGYIFGQTMPTHL